MRSVKRNLYAAFLLFATLAFSTSLLEAEPLAGPTMAASQGGTSTPSATHQPPPRPQLKKQTSIRKKSNEGQAPLPALSASHNDDDASKITILWVSTILSAIIGVIALIVSVRNTNSQIVSSNQNANAQRWREANQKEVEQLEELLRTFHVPFLVRSEANRNMAQDLRERLKDPNYRMLIKLLDPHWLEDLPQGDRTIVEEVCRTGLELRTFIELYGGRVDAKLADHLARASTHFRMLWLAFDKKLGDDPLPFEGYVYPRQLDDALKIDRERITNRIKMLRAAPSENHGIIDQLTLPPTVALQPWPNPARSEPVTSAVKA